VYFCHVDRAIGQSNASVSLAFAPPRTSIDSPQPSDFANTRSGGKRLNLKNLANELEMHGQIVAMPIKIVNRASPSIWR
jgi:hypothetical protein